MTRFGTSHGDILDRHVSHWGSTPEKLITVITSEIVTVNYNDGSRPSTAVMQEAEFTLTTHEGVKHFQKRVPGKVPVVINQDGASGEFTVELSSDKETIMVTLGADIVADEVKQEAYRPVASDSRMA